MSRFVSPFSLFSTRCFLSSAALSRSISYYLPSSARYFSSYSVDPSVLDAPHQKNKNRPKVFHDRVRLQVTGGHGGNGCSSFARTDKGKGAPDGGNGGKGGSVYLETSSDLHQYSFSSFHLRGQPGKPGSSDQQHGPAGQDHIALIPPGTIVREIIGRDPETDELVFRHVADLNSGGLRLKVAEGGIGGFGNRVFKTDYRQNNRFSTNGGPGDSRWIQLELKTIADIGLIGFPNAGKSSLLAALSAAKPKIANYPFTTIQPEVGTVELKRYFTESQLREIEVQLGSSSSPSSDMTSPRVPIRFSIYDQLTVADLPGLIEGAHQNIGLGHAFLKHIERCSVLLFVLDCSIEYDDLSHTRLHSPSQSLSEIQTQRRDPVRDFLTLQEELIRYNPALLQQKPILIFANKQDERPALYRRNVERLQRLLELSRSIPQLEQQRDKGKFFTKKTNQSQSDTEGQSQSQSQSAASSSSSSGITSGIRVIQGSAKEKRGLQELVKELMIVVQQAKRMGIDQIEPEKEIRIKRKSKSASGGERPAAIQGYDK